MKLALISDVHSNLPALEAVLAKIRRMGIARVIHAGDVVGYNAFPNEVIAAFIKERVESIKGNHDIACINHNFEGFDPVAAQAGEWTSKNLSMHSSVYLMGMREHQELNIDGIRIAVHHGSPSNPDEYVMPDASSPDLLRKAKAGILVLGHTHWPFVARYAKGFVLNPGSVGQPRDGDWRASFATLEIEDGAALDASVRRVDYDVRETMRAGKKVGLHQRLIDRLAKGI